MSEGKVRKKREPYETNFKFRIEDYDINRVIKAYNRFSNKKYKYNKDRESALKARGFFAFQKGLYRKLAIDIFTKDKNSPEYKSSKRKIMKSKALLRVPKKDKIRYFKYAARLFHSSTSYALGKQVNSVRVGQGEKKFRYLVNFLRRNFAPSPKSKSKLTALRAKIFGVMPRRIFNYYVSKMGLTKKVYKRKGWKNTLSLRASKYFDGLSESDHDKHNLAIGRMEVIAKAFKDRKLVSKSVLES